MKIFAILSLIPVLAAAQANNQAIFTCTQPKTFALTFDDGIYDHQAALLKSLKGSNATATFFVNGLNWRCIYDNAEMLQQTYLAGHTIASHTWSHKDITALNSANFFKELELLETALDKILGIKPAFFRPPYGAVAQSHLNALAKRGYRTIMWDHDSRDTLGDTPQQSRDSYKQLTRTFPTPHIALNHDVKESTVKEVMPYTIKTLKAKGWTLVTVNECLGLPAYQVEKYKGKALPQRDATWKC